MPLYNLKPPTIAQVSPALSSTSAIEVPAAIGAEIAPADPSKRLRIISIQVESGSLNLYNGGSADEDKLRVREIPEGVVYELSFRGQLWGLSSGNFVSLVNVSIDV